MFGVLQYVSIEVANSNCCVLNATTLKNKLKKILIILK